VPVIVRAHPGPTSNAPLRLDQWVQFFVGQGFAVLDVDYRGSTGYGRAYRNALRGQWGLLDVSDCVDAVQAGGQDGSVDLARVVISGTSAGGYTALRAATNTTRFRAATVRSTIVDLPHGVLPHRSSSRIMPTFSWVQSALGGTGQCSAPV
jgi:dipeptidyl aminopeptidase/acylaminoacyl peptidase